MSVTLKVLIVPKTAEAVATAQYTAVNCQTIIDKFTVTNPTASATTITIYIVAAGGTADDSNTLVHAKSIAAGDSYLCPEMVGQVMSANSQIITLASTSPNLTISAAGREVA